jgi:uncharacterized protein YebE (UPF0316 family)
MEDIFSQTAIMAAAFIFILRVADMTLETLRVLFVMRGKKGPAWFLGFFQAAIFVTAIGTVLANVTNPLSIVAYAAGFATGNVTGMYIEGKLAVGHTLLNIISPGRGSAIAEKLRGEGYAVTEIPARGKDGMVTLLNCSVLRKKTADVRKMVMNIDESAFITADDIQPIRRGYWRA